MAILRTAVLLVLVLTGADAFAFETWQVEERQLRLDVTAFGAFASKQFRASGDLLTIVDEHTSGRYEELGTSFDAEFGVFTNIAIYVSSSVRAATLRSEFGSARTVGMSDFHLGGKWRVLDSAVTLTIAPELTFPTGYSTTGGSLRPVLGDGVNEFTARVWLGKRFAEAPLYFEVGTGYRLRGGRVPHGGGPRLRYADEIPYNAEAGYWFTRSIAAHLFLDGVATLGDPEQLSAVKLSPLARSQTNIGGGATYRFNRTFRVTGQYRHAIAGVNSLRSQFLGVGLTVDYGS